MKTILSHKRIITLILLLSLVLIAMLYATNVPSAKVNGTLAVEGTVDVALTGTVGATNGSSAITGSGTAFTTELEVDNAIAIASSVAAGYEVFTVSAITNDTSLTIDSNYAGTTATGLDAWCDPDLLEIDNGDGTNLLTVDKSGNLDVAGTAEIGAYTLPKVDGTNEQVLKTNGSGVVSWEDGGSRFVHRDPGSYDFQVGSLTTDGNWHDLDLSSIAPAGTKAVLLRVFIKEDHPNYVIYLRKKGDTGVNASKIRTQVVDIEIYGDPIVAVDDDRKIEYLATNTTWTQINIVVGGWWL